MNTTTDAPVVVVTEEKKRRKGLAWVAAGAALLLGGSTFALWSASDSFTGGTITAGDLNLTTLEDTRFWDVSTDRTDQMDQIPGTDGSRLGHAVNGADWRIVPGDTAAVSFPAVVTLEGDNLVANLKYSGLTAGMDNPQLHYSYEVYLGQRLVVSESPLETGEGGLMFLSAPVHGQENGMDDTTVPPGAPAVDGQTARGSVFGMDMPTEELTVVVYAYFDEATPGREQVQVSDALGDLSLHLMQVRDTGLQFG